MEFVKDMFSISIVDISSHQQLLRIIKAKLQKERIFFLIHLFARDILLMKKMEIEKTKPTCIICISFKIEY